MISMKTQAVTIDRSRVAEYAALRRAGASDLAAGRLYEGHVNALQLVRRYGTPLQASRADAEAAAGLLFGVWNTQAADGVTFVHEGARGAYRLAGRKTFCSGTGRVARAIVTASDERGASQMFLVRMDAIAPSIDATFWRPMGMEQTESFAIDFTGIRLAPDDALGASDAYQREPWFSGGAARFVAVQTGACERLVADLARFLAAVNRGDDAIQRARLGECAVHARTAILWTDTCVRAWEAFDRGGDREPLLETVDCARIAVERAALALCESVERAVGARGLLEPYAFGRTMRDLRMYLRQPAPDAAVARVGAASLARAT